MIRIRKPSLPPPVLRGRGIALRDALVSQAKRGSFEFLFDADVYGHLTVKEALISAQYGKCAFCESKFTHVAYGDVEHFRPKAAVEENGTLRRPGYFWLTYDWRNLYASCQICNQRHKRNAFPVLGRRATYDGLGMSGERPLFVDPGRGNPERHIGFIDSVPFGLTERGRVTIKALGLDRESLNAARRDRLQVVESFLRTLTILVDDPAANDRSLIDESSVVSAIGCAITRNSRR